MSGSTAKQVRWVPAVGCQHCALPSGHLPVQAKHPGCATRTSSRQMPHFCTATLQSPEVTAFSQAHPPTCNPSC